MLISSITTFHLSSPHPGRIHYPSSIRLGHVLDLLSRHACLDRPLDFLSNPTSNSIETATLYKSTPNQKRTPPSSPAPLCLCTYAADDVCALPPFDGRNEQYNTQSMPFPRCHVSPAMLAYICRFIHKSISNGHLLSLIACSHPQACCAATDTLFASYRLISLLSQPPSP